MTYLISGLDTRAGLRGGGSSGVYGIMGLGVDKGVLATAKGGGDVAAAKAASAQVAASQKIYDGLATKIRASFKLPASGLERTAMLQAREAAVLKALGPRPVQAKVVSVTKSAAGDLSTLQTLDLGPGSDLLETPKSNTMLIAGAAAVALIAFVAMRK